MSLSLPEKRRLFRQRVSCWVALFWCRAKWTLPIALLLGLLFALSGCGSQPEVRGRDSSQDPCDARFSPGETVRVVATTGQIGDVVSMVAGLKPLDSTLWTVSEITRHSSWNPGDF